MPPDGSEARWGSGIRPRRCIPPLPNAVLPRALCAGPPQSGLSPPGAAVSAAAAAAPEPCGGGSLVSFLRWSRLDCCGGGVFRFGAWVEGGSDRCRSSDSDIPALPPLQDENVTKVKKKKMCFKRKWELHLSDVACGTGTEGSKTVRARASP